MGVVKLFSSSSYDPPQQVRGNPNPKNYEILRHEEIGEGDMGLLIVEAKYPEATTFEGRKILVYIGISIDYLKRQACVHGLDPHFAANRSMASPIARFVPVEAGWELAVAFCRFMWRNAQEIR